MRDQGNVQRSMTGEGPAAARRRRMRPARGVLLGAALLAGLLGPAVSSLGGQEDEGRAATAADTGRAEAAARRQRSSRTLEVRPATSEIQVDGVLDEPAWGDALSVSLDYEWTPGDNVPAPVRTTCHVTYDASNLYLACDARDPDPDDIRAHLADRDTPFQDDHVVFLLDTFNDRRRAFQFRVNPFGVQMDALLSQGFEDFSWDAIWNSAGRITERGYVVEVAIPFKSLSFQPTQADQRWGFIAERSWPRSVRHRMRQVMTRRGDPCLLCQADELVGFAGVKPGRDIELNPTLTTSRTDRRADISAPALETGDVEVEPGLNIRWRVTPNTALDATVNPDFSQVEADVAQLEVNRRFALFFPEKRPFFLEGADLFDVPGNLIFTRTVVDPIAGGKITGKVGGNSFGAFVTRDEVNSLVVPGPQSSSSAFLEDDVTAGVFRYRRDVGQSSTVGLIATDREAPGYHNRLLGVDADIRVGRSHTFSGLVAHTSTDYPDSLATGLGQPTESFEGQGLSASYNYSSRNVFAFASYDHVEPDLRADAGFLPQVGFRGPEAGAFYTFWGSADRWFSRIQVGSVLERQEDFDGELLERTVNLSANYSGPLQSVVDVDLNVRREAFAGETFDLFVPSVFFSLRPSGDLSFNLQARLGDAIDFENVREADIFRIGPGVDFKIGPRLEGNASHTLERLSLDGERIFLANLIQGRLLWHFSRRAFVRAIVQFRDLSRNLELYTFPAEAEVERLFTQFLFSYEVNPRTVLFAGYSDNRLGLTEASLTGMNRSFFLKLGYAWRP